MNDEQDNDKNKNEQADLSKDRESKSSLKNSFNGSALWGTISSITFCTLFTLYAAMTYAQQDEKGWLAGAVIGALGAVSGVIKTVQMARKEVNTRRVDEKYIPYDSKDSYDSDDPYDDKFGPKP